MKTMLGFKIFKGSERGVGLVEVLVSLSIFAAVGVIFLMGLQTSGKSVIISQQHVTGENLAKSAMEDVKGQTYATGATSYSLATPVPADLTAQGYAVTVAAALPPGHASDDGIQRITIAVTYRGNVEFTLVDYKVH